MTLTDRERLRGEKGYGLPDFVVPLLWSFPLPILLSLAAICGFLIATNICSVHTKTIPMKA